IKMGGYGMIRVCVSIFPQVAQQFAQLLVIFAVITVLYGAAVTLRQTDLKRLIAYSSISHMGYVLLGVFALSQVSLRTASPHRYGKAGGYCQANYADHYQPPLALDNQVKQDYRYSEGN
ncbi:unnamed protein product, partial [marine sediment metagenome]